jgi:3-hydroxyethyl bacteriochlorophyllide a dehydrogenase
METNAVVLSRPERLAINRLELTPPGAADVIVDVAYSGISTGTERLLFEGRMPAFPGMGYPLVPGYESVGRIADGKRAGQMVFIPGATCFKGARGLFGATASRLVVPAAKAVPIDSTLGARGVLMALAATAQHVIAGGSVPDLIVGHGVVGRLLGRLAVAAGGEPVVWETQPSRMGGATGYRVSHPTNDPRRDYKCICDASGDSTLLDSLIGRIAPGGEIVLAGFYSERLSFAFPMAFMREARFRVAAQWQPADLETVRIMTGDGTLSLDGLISHHSGVDDANAAYRTAFGDPACLKMILDWSAHA